MKHSKNSRNASLQFEEMEDMDQPDTPLKADALATINDLPDELIQDIVTQLTCPSDELDRTRSLAELAKFSRTNRRFHRIGSPSLYSEYRGRYDPYLFLRTISANPKLGKMVERAIFYYRYAGPTRMHWDHKRPDFKDFKEIAEGFRRLGLTEWEGQAKKVNQPYVVWEKLHAAILLHTPNIKFVDYGRDAHSDMRADETFQFFTGTGHLSKLAKLAGHEHLLGNLSQMSITGGRLCTSRFLSGRCYGEPLYIFPLFKVETLRRLELTYVFDRASVGGFPRSKVPISCNSLETFSFIDGFARPEMLEFILESTRHLQHLNIAFVRGPNRMMPQDNLYTIENEMALTKILRPVRHSLKTFRLHYHGNIRVDIGGVVDETLLPQGEAHEIELKCNISDLLNAEHPGSMNLNNLLPPFRCTASIRTSDASVAEWLKPQSLNAGRGSDEPWTASNALKYSIEYLRAAHAELVRNLILNKLGNPSIGLVASANPESNEGAEKWFRERCGRRESRKQDFPFSISLPSVACCYR